MAEILLSLLKGLGVSFQIFLITLILSLPLGLLVSLGRMSRNGPLSALIRIYISIMRGTPLMLQLFVVYYGPYYLFRIRLSPGYRNIAVCIGFVINYAAYFAEIYRSGIQSIPLDELGEEKVGDTISADIFNVGDSVDVRGVSKGKGWAGTIKRHNFHRQRKTHGGKGNTRKIGSIGSMYPQRIWKGHPMAGQMGGEQVTVKNLSVAYIDSAKNLIGVKGAVPGPKKGIVVISSAKQFGHGKEAK